MEDDCRGLHWKPATKTGLVTLPLLKLLFWTCEFWHKPKQMEEIRLRCMGCIWLLLSGPKENHISAANIHQMLQTCSWRADTGFLQRNINSLFIHWRSLFSVLIRSLHITNIFKVICAEPLRKSKAVPHLFSIAPSKMFANCSSWHQMNELQSVQICYLFHLLLARVKGHLLISCPLLKAAYVRWAAVSLTDINTSKQNVLG